jgi:hypothetical protein
VLSPNNESSFTICHCSSSSFTTGASLFMLAS